MSLYNPVSCLVSVVSAIRRLFRFLWCFDEEASKNHFFRQYTEQGVSLLSAIYDGNVPAIAKVVWSEDMARDRDLTQVVREAYANFVRVSRIVTCIEGLALVCLLGLIASILAVILVHVSLLWPIITGVGILVCIELASRFEMFTRVDDLRRLDYRSIQVGGNFVQCEDPTERRIRIFALTQDELANLARTELVDKARAVLIADQKVRELRLMEQVGDDELVRAIETKMREKRSLESSFRYYQGDLCIISDKNLDAIWREADRMLPAVLKSISPAVH